jgi:hypothetical protein
MAGLTCFTKGRGRETDNYHLTTLIWITRAVLVNAPQCYPSEETMVGLTVKEEKIEYALTLTIKEIQLLRVC